MAENKISSLIKLFAAKGWRWWTSRFLSGAVGLILLISGLLKSTDMEIFIQQIRDYEIISHHVLLIVGAWGIILAEITLGTALLISYRPKLTIPSAVLLLLVFLGATLWAWSSGMTKDCGCFGTWIRRTPGEAMIEDFVLLVALFFAWLGQRRSLKPLTLAKSWAFIGACIAGLILPVVFGFSISQNSRFRPESNHIKQDLLEVQGLDQVDLKHGTYIFVLMGTDCLHCKEAVEELNILVQEADLAELIALCADNEDQIRLFEQEYQPIFPIRKIEENEFWRLLGEGDIPYVILVRDQRVLKVWNVNIPGIDDVNEELNGA